MYHVYVISENVLVHGLSWCNDKCAGIQNTV